MKKKIAGIVTHAYIMLMLAVCMGAVILLLQNPANAFADSKPEPPVDSEAYLRVLHVDQPASWRPFQSEPSLSVTYESITPDLAMISDDGSLTLLKEGWAELSAHTPGNEQYCEYTFTSSFEIVSGEDGLYLTEGEPHFYYQGAKYEPGVLGADIERELCKSVPALKVYIEDYLEPYQKLVPDRTEAALTALLNYGANYYKKYFRFEGMGGQAEAGKTQWMVLLRTHRGVCAPTASLFCYMMYISGLPAMETDSGGNIEERAHTWSLIEHDGYYYNFEEYDFMVGIRNRYVIPPFTAATAAYFQEKIYGNYFVHFSVSGAALTPGTKVADMGRDLSGSCPVLMYEKLSDGSYRARFETIRKGSIPRYEDGTAISLKDVTYKNMECDAFPGAEGEEAQLNEYALPLFKKADGMLSAEISCLFESQEEEPEDCEHNWSKTASTMSITYASGAGASKTKTIKANKAVKGKKISVISISGNNGPVSCRLVSVKKSGKSCKKYFKINSSTGKVTIKKNLRKGTYKFKIKVTDAGDAAHVAATQTVVVKVKIK